MVARLDNCCSLRISCCSDELCEQVHHAGSRRASVGTGEGIGSMFIPLVQLLPPRTPPLSDLSPHQRHHGPPNGNRMGGHPHFPDQWSTKFPALPLVKMQVGPPQPGVGGAFINIGTNDPSRLTDIFFGLLSLTPPIQLSHWWDLRHLMCPCTTF